MSRVVPTDPEVAEPSRFAAIGAVLTGVLWIASFPPFDLGALAWIAFVPWFAYLRRASRRGAFFVSAAVAAVHVGVSIAWLARLTPPGLVALMVYLGLYAGIAGCWIRSILRVRGRFEAIEVASVWVGLEFLRSLLFTGFPWLLVGHTQYAFPLFTQVADLGGVYATGFVVVAVNAATARVLADRASLRSAVPSIGAAACLVVATLVYGGIRLNAPADEAGPKIAAVQANIGVSLKHAPTSQAQILREHYMLSRDAMEQHADIDLVVWSETMFPIQWDENEPRSVDECLDIVRSMELGVPFLTGITVVEEGESDPTAPGYRQFNRALLFDRNAAPVASYDKMHLVPGGEMIPFGDLLPYRAQLEQAFYELAGWYPTLSAGESATILELETESGSIPFGVLICYDSVFPTPARDLAARGARFLINISNDGWYGKSAELEQILAITAFRAIEGRIPVFRATNTGISAVTDSRGRILERLRDEDGNEKEVRGTLVARVGLGPGGSLYSVVGDAFSWVLLAAAAGLLVTRALRRFEEAPAAPPGRE